MAADTITVVREGLAKAFKKKGAKARVFAERSDYKDFVRLYVISDYFRRKSEKERLGEIFSMLESAGAKDALGKISLCVTMTNREYEREFGRGVWLGEGALGGIHRGVKSKPGLPRPARIHARA